MLTGFWQNRNNSMLCVNNAISVQQYMSGGGLSTLVAAVRRQTEAQAQ